MNLYNISYCGRSRSCDEDIPFLKVYAIEENIDNPSNDLLLDMIDHGLLASCHNCNTQGDFDITMIEFGDLVYEPFHTVTQTEKAQKKCNYARTEKTKS